jgi:hypothetical protein
MYARLTGFLAVLGIASFAFWKAAKRPAPGIRSVELDDDTAAEIIRRMLPALDRVYRMEFA